MRNFKKFLALVLAMLMVSACAVSVSAAYADQAAIDDTGFAKAVAMLTELGVVKGDGEGFRPNDTLRRDEAAVMAAKLVAGAKGQTYDWTAATCDFADVEAAWSFAFINYVGQKGIMQGDGTGFAPERALQIDEAIKIAVVATDAAKAREALEDTEQYKPSYWATYWISAATELNLLNGIDVFNYKQPCSRAMFAQIIYNAFENNATIKNSFGYFNINASVAVKDGVVTLTNVAEKLEANDPASVQVTVDYLNEALAAAGYTETAADLTNSRVNFTWFNATKKILSVKILTTAKTVLYNDEAIKFENVYEDKDNNGSLETLNTEYLVIGGVKYKVGATDKKGSTDILGGTASDTVGITLTVDSVKVDPAKVETLPKYFKAALYDDNGDGDFERCDILKYEIINAKADGKTKDEKQVNYVVNGANLNKDDNKEVVWTTWTGVETVLDGETPMLAKITAGDKTYSIDVIETAKSVTGKLTNLGKKTSSAPAYAVIDNNKYFYENDNVVVDSTTLKQTVTVFTINNALVKVAGASFTPVTVIVDKATVNADGKVVLTGFNASSFLYEDFILDGAYVDGKLQAYNGHYVDFENILDEDGKVLVTAEDANKKYAKFVALGGKQDKDGNWSDEIVESFVEGVFYNLVKTADGLYFKGEKIVEVTEEVENEETGETETVVTGKYVETLDTFFATKLTNEEKDNKFQVNEKYVYINGVPKYHNNSTSVIVKIDAEGDAVYNAYSTTYTVLTAYAETKNVVAHTNSTKDSKVALVYITNKGIALDVKTTEKKIADGQTIVQILGEFIEADFDFFTYNAFDIINNKKLTVKSATGDLEVGEFYLVAGDEVVEDDPTGWVTRKTIYSEVSGVVTKYTAYPTEKKQTNDEAPVYEKAAKAVEFGDIQIVIFDTGDNNVIDFNDDGSAKTLKLADVLKKSSNTFADAYVVEDLIVIIK